MIRRSVLVLTLPVWGTIIGIFCLIGAARTEWHWLRTGDWLLSDELPPFWMDHVELTFGRWLARWS